MSWVTQRPEDWQLGGQSDAFLWGSGRHGQLAENGRSAFTPAPTPSFSKAQHVCYSNRAKYRAKNPLSYNSD